MMKPKVTSVKSSWTPLNNDEANAKMYQERRSLVGKWFDKWNDEQRRQVLKDLVEQCKPRQLEYTSDIINRRKPQYHMDFTCHLPRVITLYLFSYLDPRSLCRSAKVCWHWKYLTEVDQLWMPKCVRRGWILPFSPSPYEVGTWKRLYIENVTKLNCPQIKSSFLADLEKLSLNGEKKNDRPPRPKSNKPPPWRGSDPAPKDTWRNNYLDNKDEVNQVNKLRKKGVYGSESEEITRRAKKKVNTGQIAQRSSSLPRSKSSLGIYTQPGERPDWARSQDYFGDLTGRSGMNSPLMSQRPGPVQPVQKVKTTKQASNNDKTIVISGNGMDGFQSQPWLVKNGEDYDSDS